MKKNVLKLLTVFLILSLAACRPAAKHNVSTDESTAVSDESSVQESETEASTEASEKSTEAEVPVTLPTLNEIFAAHGMKVGTCLSAQMIGRDQTNRLILEQFNSVTMENSMKPDAILSQKKSREAGTLVVDFNKDALKMLDWAKENHFSMRGHTLVWYSQTPEWIFHRDFDTSSEYVNREEMLSRMESMISQVFQKLDELGYIDLFYAYDVVNEAWMEDGTMRENHWKEIIGDDYLWYAFYYADKYAPESIDLYYNDYNEQFKTDALYQFVNTLVDENGEYLIDGIGLQAHLYTSDNLDQYFKTVEKLGSTGLKLQLTELDVCLGSWQHPEKAEDENLQKQGRFYYNLINGLFERQDAGLIHMDALTFWGFSDSMSWRREYSPLLYNSSLKPKYALYGALQMKENAGF